LPTSTTESPNMKNAGTRGCAFVTLSNKARRREHKQELEYAMLLNSPSAKDLIFVTAEKQMK